MTQSKTIISPVSKERKNLLAVEDPASFPSNIQSSFLFFFFSFLVIGTRCNCGDLFQRSIWASSTAGSPETVLSSVYFDLHTLNRS